MFFYSIIHSRRWLLIPSLIIRSLSNNHRFMIKNFDRKTFDYFNARRLEKFNGNHEQMSINIHKNLQQLFQTTSIENYLINSNSKSHIKQFSQMISIEQFNDILFFAYEHNLQLDLFIKHLLKCISINNKSISFELYLELIYLLVLHQQKHYDQYTKIANENLKNLIYPIELNLTNDQIKTISLFELSLLSSTMYRLQLPLKNNYLLELIGKYLIDDEINKSLSAMDKQNFLKILSLSNYRQIRIAQALVNRFNQSFEQHLHRNLTSFSLEIVRMTMRIALYLSLLQFYSERFFENCIKLIELESLSSQPIYRAKDIIQIMNTLIFMGYIRKINDKYINLIDIYDQMNQFEHKPERLIDVLAPLSSIDYFPDNLLKKLFTKENLLQLNESRMKEKTFFIFQSNQLFHSSSQIYLDQDYLNSLPHHIFGSWTIEKRKRPNFTLIIQRLFECVPDRSYVKSAFLLKHFKSPDIIICLNVNQQPQRINNGIKKSLGFFEEDENICSIYALQVLSKDELSINEPFRPLGLVYSKARQLQKLKYKPIFIYPNDILHEIKTSKEVFQWIIERAQITERLLNEK